MHVRDPNTHQLNPVDLLFPVNGGDVEIDGPNFKLTRSVEQRVEYLNVKMKRCFINEMIVRNKSFINVWGKASNCRVEKFPATFAQTLNAIWTPTIGRE